MFFQAHIPCQRKRFHLTSVFFNVCSLANFLSVLPSAQVSKVTFCVSVCMCVSSLSLLLCLALSHSPALIEEACAPRPSHGPHSLAAGETSEDEPLPGGVFLGSPRSDLPLQASSGTCFSFSLIFSVFLYISLIYSLFPNFFFTFSLYFFSSLYFHASSFFLSSCPSPSSFFLLESLPICA